MRSSLSPSIFHRAQRAAAAQLISACVLNLNCIKVPTWESKRVTLRDDFIFIVYWAVSARCAQLSEPHWDTTRVFPVSVWFEWMSVQMIFKPPRYIAQEWRQQQLFGPGGKWKEKERTASVALAAIFSHDSVLPAVLLSTAIAIFSFSVRRRPERSARFLFSRSWQNIVCRRVDRFSSPEKSSRKAAVFARSLPLPFLFSHHLHFSFVSKWRRGGRSGGLQTLPVPPVTPAKTKFARQFDTSLLIHRVCDFWFDFFLLLLLVSGIIWAITVAVAAAAAFTASRQSKVCQVFAGQVWFFYYLIACLWPKLLYQLLFPSSQLSAPIDVVVIGWLRWFC